MPKSTSRGTYAPGQKGPLREPSPFGLPDEVSLTRFIIESDLQRRIQDDRSREPKIVKRDEV